MHYVSSYVGEGQCRATARVQRRLLSANTAQVEECTVTFLFVTAATDRPSTAGCSQTSGHAELRSLQVGAVALLSMTAVINTSDSAHDFSMKVSLFIVAACSGSPPQCSTFSSYYMLGTTTKLSRPFQVLVLYYT